MSEASERPSERMSTAERAIEASSAEQANEWAVRVNEWTEERMTKYSTRQFHSISTHCRLVAAEFVGQDFVTDESVANGMVAIAFMENKFMSDQFMTGELVGNDFLTNEFLSNELLTSWSNCC